MKPENLGQHTLKDEQVLDLIVTFAELSANDTVLEVGAEPGNLTRP